MTKVFLLVVLLFSASFSTAYSDISVNEKMGDKPINCHIRLLSDIFSKSYKFASVMDFKANIATPAAQYNYFLDASSEHMKQLPVEGIYGENIKEFAAKNPERLIRLVIGNPGKYTEELYLVVSVFGPQIRGKETEYKSRATFPLKVGKQTYGPVEVEIPSSNIGIADSPSPSMDTLKVEVSCSNS